MAATNQRRVTIDVSLRSFLYFFLSIAIVGFIWYVSEILLLIFVSIVFTAALEPTVKAMQRLKIPRILAIALLYLALFGIVIFTISLVIPTVSTQIKTLSENLPSYQQRLQQSVAHTPALQKIIAQIADRISSSSELIASNFAAVILRLFGSLVGFITFLVLTFYMLAGGKKMVLAGFDFIPQDHLRKRLINLSTAISTRLGYWLRGQVTLGVIIFVASLVGLSLLRVEYALTLALIAGIMELVPLLGAYLGAIPAILVGFTISPSKGIAVAILFLVLQQIEGHIIVPQVMKRALGLPPIVILPAVLIGGKLLGFIGVLLAAPIAAAILVISEDIMRQPNLDE